jgi:hypothetical protein
MTRTVIISDSKGRYISCADPVTWTPSREEALRMGEIGALVLLDRMRGASRRSTEGTVIVYVR